MDGIQSVDMMPQTALAAIADGSPCDDCKCCEDESTVDASTCGMGCGGIIISLLDAEVSDVIVSAVLFTEASRRQAGFSIAPDPSPPRFLVLT